MLEEGIENSVENHSGDLLAAIDRVQPVHEYFRLDDRHELLLLQREAYRASACAFARKQAELGRVSVT